MLSSEAVEVLVPGLEVHHVVETGALRCQCYACIASSLWSCSWYGETAKKGANMIGITKLQLMILAEFRNRPRVVQVSIAYDARIDILGPPIHVF